MTAVMILERFEQRGVSLMASGDRLKWQAPKGTLKPVDLNTLAESKWTLLAELLAASTSDPERWREMFDERAGVMEFDGGFQRAEAERRAYLEVLSDMGKG